MLLGCACLLGCKKVGKEGFSGVAICTSALHRNSMEAEIKNLLYLIMGFFPLEKKRKKKEFFSEPVFSVGLFSLKSPRSDLITNNLVILLGFSANLKENGVDGVVKS